MGATVFRGLQGLIAVPHRFINETANTRRLLGKNGS
jgi:hypothetical protein